MITGPPLDRSRGLRRGRRWPSQREAAEKKRYLFLLEKLSRVVVVSFDAVNKLELTGSLLLILFEFKRNWTNWHCFNCGKKDKHANETKFSEYLTRRLPEITWCLVRPCTTSMGAPRRSSPRRCRGPGGGGPTGPRSVRSDKEREGNMVKIGNKW